MTRPPSPCQAPGCAALSVARYCPAHQHMARESGRLYDRHTRARDAALSLAAKIRNSWQWKKVTQIVRREEPFCRDPFHEHETLPAPTAAIHHIEPLATHPELAFVRTNLAGLCARCHNRIESMERKGEPTAHLFKCSPSPVSGFRPPV